MNDCAKKMFFRIVGCVLMSAALFCCACSRPQEQTGTGSESFQHSQALPTGVVERDMVINAGQYPLAAKLTLPQGGEKLPAVIILHGSGPMDMDGTTGVMKPYRDLAYGLASRGIAVLRYDKRTYSYQSQLDPETLTLFDEVIADACEAYLLLESLPEIDSQHILLLGHSMGGMLLPMLDEYLPRMAGNILMAAPAGGLHRLIGRQYDYLVEQGYADAAWAAELHKQVENVEQLTQESTFTAEELLGASKDYWLELQSYDPLKTLTKFQLPVLLLQGKRDYQVPVDQWEAYQDALQGSGATAVCYPSLNHLFCAGEGASTPLEYEVPAAMDEAVLDDIAAWIVSLKGTSATPA